MTAAQSTSNALALDCETQSSDSVSSRLIKRWMPQRNFCGWFGWLLIAVLMPHSLALSAQEPAQESTSQSEMEEVAADPEAIAFFESKIRPVLIERCYECHSHETQAEEGGLRVDDREALRRGGDSGPAVVPGSLDDSKLLAAIRYGTDFYQMPPDGRLDDAVIADFVRWIEMGAADPREAVEGFGSKKTEIDWDTAREHWAFVPPVALPTPETSPRADTSGAALMAAGPIDAYWLDELGKADVTPAAEASKRHLLRRMFLDLTGLPPSAEELNAFETDSRPDATQRTLDRLLASPQYGERWGRHWLDVARYADSNGLDENLAYINAFRYRDWVIQALNQDFPYDDFVRWQIAGDLIPSSPQEPTDAPLNRLIATGFLSIGAKMLACDDGHKMELDIIDEQIDTTGKAVLGMTFGCARCHDHKFDPISQRDYYAMAGVFKSTHTMENFNVVAVWHEHELALPAERERRDQLKQQAQTLRQQQKQTEQAALQALDQHWNERKSDYALALLEMGSLDPREVSEGRWSLAESIGYEQLPASDWKIEAEAFDRGTLTPDDSTWGKGIGVLLHAGFAEYDFTLEQAGSYSLEFRFAAAESRGVRLFIDGQEQPGLVATEVTGGWPVENQRWHPIRKLELTAGPHVLRIEREGPVPHLDKIALVRLLPPSAERESIVSDKSLRSAIFADGIAAWFHRDRSVARETLRAAWEADPTTTEQSLRERFAQAPPAADAAPSEQPLEKALVELRRLWEPGGPAHPGEQRSRWLTQEETTSIAQLNQQALEVEQQVPTFETAMGVREGKPTDLPVHIRGNYLTLGDEQVPRGWPYVFTNLQSTPLVTDQQVSGRLDFANWITNPEHPLTWRVIANRLWRWHFGRGIVPTPDNFGLLGLPPTHPALLDHLALDLVSGDWSLKRMHHRIMSSRMYATSSDYPLEAAEKDPENLLWWRIPRRRLLAEEMRDSLLAVSFGLEQRMFGSILNVSPRQYVSGPAQAPNTYASGRRSVYLPILRSAVYDVLQAFDFPDPAVANGDRATSTIAPQALFALNSSIVVQASERLAEAALHQASEPESQVNFLVSQVLGRSVRADELARSLAAMQRYAQQIQNQQGIETPNAQQQAEFHRRSLGMLARVLMASNEFAFVD